MASTQKKTTAPAQKSTSSKGTKTASSKGGSRASASTRTKKKAQSQKKPIRREVGGIVLLVLALCTAVSYVGISAIFIDYLAALLKGLFGYGYFLAAPAMVFAGAILLFHHGRPVQLRTTCALLTPMMLGVLTHILFCRKTFPDSMGLIPRLWSTGKDLTSGGVLSGALAEGSVALVAKLPSVIIFTVLLIAMLMTSMHLTVGTLVEKHRQRVRYEEEEEEQLPIVTRESVRRREQPRAQIDFALDEELPPAIPAPQSVPKKRSFFRSRSAEQKTPDQVLAEQHGETAAEPVKKKPAPLPVQEEVIPPAAVVAEPPVVEPIRPVSVDVISEPAVSAPEKPKAPAPLPLEEEPASSRKEKNTTAREVAAQTAAVTEEIQRKMEEEEEIYHYPPITLLQENRGGNFTEAGAELRNNSRRLAETLASFGVDATPGDVVHGPSITRYEFMLDQGVKLSKITNLADDIALALGASGVRIAPIPDKISVVGIEVPNKQVTPVLIRDVIESRDFAEHTSNVAFALGRDISGRNVIGNIEKLPHVLIAGTTGSGKSVCTNSLIISLLYKSTPDEVRFIMVDPKMVELAPYNGIPHLLIPVVTDPKKAAGALQWAVFEMMKRYKTFSECGVKKLEEFNRLARTREDMETLPAVVVVIDELADLMLVAAKEVEESICRVAQMGRAAGVHLVIATQRPSADVITGLMKANIPSRIAFAVASSLESRIILDNTGAEKLVGKGDMLYAPLGGGKPTRVQGCFISPEEIERVVEHVKQSGEAQYSDEVIAKIEQSVQEKEKGGKGGSAGPVNPGPGGGGEEGDELLPAAVEVVLETGQASVSMLQRRLKLGYSRAARLVDQMEEQGIVGPFEGSKPRQLLITREKWQEMKMGGGSIPEAPEIAPGEDGCL